MKTNRLIAYFLIIILLGGFAVAKDNDSFVLSEEYGENLYLTNNNIEIKSNLYGDLFAVTDSLKVTAMVEDDLNAVAGNFLLDGTVGSDLRLVSPTIVIDGTVFGESMLLGNNIILSDTSVIGGDVVINANSVIINGTLKEDLKINAEKVILNGIVEGNAVIDAPQFELGPQARILGDLSSPKNVEDVSSQVDGTVAQIEGRETSDSFTSTTFNKIGVFLAIFLIGAALVFTAGKFTEKASRAAGSRFLLSLVTGFLILVAVPFIAIFVAFTVVGLPLSILLGLMYVAMIILAFGLSAVLVGKAGIKLFKGKKVLWTELLIGSLALALLSIVPAIFWPVMLILLLVSMGSFILVFIRKDKAK